MDPQSMELFGVKAILERYKYNAIKAEKFFEDGIFLLGKVIRVEIGNKPRVLLAEDYPSSSSSNHVECRLECNAEHSHIWLQRLSAVTKGQCICVYGCPCNTYYESINVLFLEECAVLTTDEYATISGAKNSFSPTNERRHISLEPIAESEPPKDMATKIGEFIGCAIGVIFLLFLLKSCFAG